MASGKNAVSLFHSSVTNKRELSAGTKTQESQAATSLRVAEGRHRENLGLLMSFSQPALKSALLPACEMIYLIV